MDYMSGVVFLMDDFVRGVMVKLRPSVEQKACLIKTSAAVVKHTMKYWQDTLHYMVKIILKYLLNPS